MNALPVADLLAPLDDDAPCGANLEYSPAFKALEDAARGKPEQQFGDTLIAAQEPDWRAVFEQALELAGQTRDLRVAVLLARAGARQQGLPTYADGLALLAGLLDQHWAHVHPQLDAEDDHDPTMRVNALLPLVASSAGLADLRSAHIGGPRSALTVRQLELAAGKAVAHAGESVPSQEGVVQALRTEQDQQPGLLDSLKSAQVEFKRIDAVLADKLGAGQGPDLRPLGSLLKCLADTAQQAQAGGAGAAAAAADSRPSQVLSTLSAPGELRSREDVVRSLDRACDWIERNEPTNPAPLLIRRAQRLMNKSFIDIIRDLVPEGLDQVEKIAGNAGG